jgi:hypothetical protein
VQHQQPLGDVDAAIGVDPDQVVVERGVVDLGQCDAVGDDRLPDSSWADIDGSTPLLSEKDTAAPMLAEPAEQGLLPSYDAVREYVASLRG